MTKHRYKPDADAFEALIRDLKQAPWLEESQRWWPDYLFHFTDLPNAISILENDVLLSRNAAAQRGWMKNDNASPEIIGTTAEKWKDWVRLYFGPRTPTLFTNEGIRPRGQWSKGAHCPVPVYFLFDSREVLKREDSWFTDGSLARGAEAQNDAAGFRKLPFSMIYHRAPVHEENKTTIVYHRHAEVVVPQKLDLGPLKRIWCRSQAEYETLLFSLSQAARNRWLKKIGSGRKPNLFNWQWTYVERVDLEKDRVIFHMNPDSKTPGPFAVKFELRLLGSGLTYVWSDNQYFLKEPLELDLSNIDTHDGYQATLLIDGYTAYANAYTVTDVPF